MERHLTNYRDFIDSLQALLKKAEQLTSGDKAARCLTPPLTGEDAPSAMLFSPHPDDECTIGTLPLRLAHEGKMRISNVAVTQGSRKDRQAARFEELKGACGFLGLNLIQTRPGGLENIKADTRRDNPDYWRDCVKVIASLLDRHKPKIIFFPHAEDWNATHIGTHYLVLDALDSMAGDFACTIVETEYWHPMTTPNLMVECPPEILADLITALSFHTGEVARNPYHLGLPAWMQDNVRRGSELIGGQGGSAPDFHFATLYRISKWANGKLSRKTMASHTIPYGQSCNLINELI